MIYSNKRKLHLSGWLQRNGINEYNSPLKLQKFLFLYEAFAKAEGDSVDFSHLRGYERGPVFSNVWGDYTKDRMEFNYAADQEFEHPQESIDADRAKRSHFIVKTLSERELSELTHKMNIWKCKEGRIKSGEYQVNLDEEDFSESDRNMMVLLASMYPSSMINNSFVIECNNKYFVLKNEDVPQLTEQHCNTLAALSDNVELHNPVYVEIDDGGCLLID